MQTLLSYPVACEVPLEGRKRDPLLPCAAGVRACTYNLAPPSRKCSHDVMYRRSCAVEYPLSRKSQRIGRTASTSRQLLARSAVTGKGFGSGKSATPTKRKKGKRTNVDADVAEWETVKKLCPCGTGKNYKDCCKLYHEGQLEPTAEAVMRARFSAYVKGEINYIIATTHPKNPAQGGSLLDGKQVSSFRQDIQATHDKVRWLRLEVLHQDSGCGSHEDEAFVAFQAWLKFKDQQGQRQCGTKTETTKERSRFLRDKVTGRWLYVDGDTDWKFNSY